MAPPDAPAARLALASLGTVQAGSGLLVLLYLAGPDALFGGFLIAAVWFAGILVASVFAFPLLWWGERTGYRAAAVTGTFALAGTALVPLLSHFHALGAILPVLIPTGLASLGLVVTGYRGLREAG